MKPFAASSPAGEPDVFVDPEKFVEHDDDGRQVSSSCVKTHDGGVSAYL